MLNGTKAYLRPLSSAVISQSQFLANQNTKPVSILPQIRSFQTSPVTRDIDSAAKFIGAGAATVGVAGSGWYPVFFLPLQLNHFNIAPVLPNVPIAFQISYNHAPGVHIRVRYVTHSLKEGVFTPGRSEIRHNSV